MKISIQILEIKNYPLEMRYEDVLVDIENINMSTDLLLNCNRDVAFAVGLLQGIFRQLQLQLRENIYINIKPITFSVIDMSSPKFYYCINEYLSFADTFSDIEKTKINGKVFFKKTTRS